MGASQENDYTISKAFPNLKIIAVEQTLTQAVVNFRDLVLEFEQLHSENKHYHQKFLTQKEKFQSQACSNCEEFKKVIATKEQILDSIASELNKAMQMKDFNVIDRILNQIYGEIKVLTPPLKNDSPTYTNTECKKNQNFTPSKEVGTVKSLEKNNLKNKTEDFVCKDETVSEIEGTPTGRKSPIFQSNKAKSNASSLILNDKKKCPESWPTPENKTFVLSYPKPSRIGSGGRLRQGRLNLVKLKNFNVVDLTCSPEYSGGGGSNSENNMVYDVKKELMDNDETILPSPTSEPVKYATLCKTIAKHSPKKFIRTSITSKFKFELETSDRNIECKLLNDENEKNIEDSINLLNQFPNRFKSPNKLDKVDDEIHRGDESVSLLQHIKKKENKNSKQVNSPSKRPLTENMNITNMPILQREANINKEMIVNDDIKRPKPVLVPVYKEPTVRRKAEKRALPGWSCGECKNFYDELYKHDPEMLAQKMDECSKHRGRNNPARPKTPDGFWNPRWDVPEDTEEFNRRNNAI